MHKTTILSIIGLTLIAALLIGCGTLGLAVRTGVVREQMITFPPGSRYQLIVRVGSDALPWTTQAQAREATAINIWVHGRGTQWHIVNLIHVPVGEPIEEPKQY
ncbi:MAG TPA: hypothetical protein VFU22_01930 [Roseiflexaceae bacterium]|nr:hypothetical protein [Roseiflexaceae bacterium]